MRGNLIEFRRRENQESYVDESIDTTPLRRSTVRFPRLRLLNQEPRPEDVKTSIARDHDSSLFKSNPQAIKIYQCTLSSKPSAEDRFIKRNYNAEASNYLLKKKQPRTLGINHIDVLNEVDSLPGNWRRKLMHELMAKECIIAGLGQKKILRGGRLTGPQNELWGEGCVEHGVWKVKPRKKPSINTMDSILEIPHFNRPSPRRPQLIDWSSKNVIAVVLEGLVTFYNMFPGNVTKQLKNVKMPHVCAVKWNHAGTKITICNLDSAIGLYCAVTEKIVWMTTCSFSLKYNTPCYVRCACWSQNDERLVTGCDFIITVFDAESGRILHSKRTYATRLLSLAFSPTYLYLAVSLSSEICIFEWPSMSKLVDIHSSIPCKALAWHPLETGLLCVSGSLDNGALSLWNVNSSKLLTYRQVSFFGDVENLVWNKHSCELVVQWSYWHDLSRRNSSVIAVLASLDRIVDTLQLAPDIQVRAIMWNSDETQLAVQYKKSVSMWNFFGKHYPYYQKRNNSRTVHKAQDKANVMSFEGFNRYNIR